MWCYVVLTVPLVFEKNIPHVHGCTMEVVFYVDDNISNTVTVDRMCQHNTESSIEVPSYIYT